MKRFQLILLILLSGKFAPAERITNAQPPKNKPEAVVSTIKVITNLNEFLKSPKDTSDLPDIFTAKKSAKSASPEIWLVASVQFNDSLIGHNVTFNVREQQKTLIFLDGELAFSADRKLEFEPDPTKQNIQEGSLIFHKVIRPRIWMLACVKNNFESTHFGISPVRLDFYLAQNTNNHVENYFHLSTACILFSFGFIYLALYIFYRQLGYNLHFSIFCLSISFSILYSVAVHDYLGIKDGRNFIAASFTGISIIYFLKFLNSYIVPEKNKFGRFMYYFVIVLCILTVLTSFLQNGFGDLFSVNGIFVIASILICIIEVLRIVITGLIRKNRQAKLVVWGILLSLSVFLSTIIYNIFNDVIIWAGDFNYTNLAMSVAGVLFPVFMGINLARDFAKKNYQLSEQVQTIEKLSEENLKKEQEKQKIILAQNENLELQVKERTTEITKQKHLIEEKQKEILDSIKYAKRIQQAHMPTEKYVEKNINRLKK